MDEHRILRHAFLAPDIQRAIVSGKQRAHLNLQAIQEMTLPLGWKKQSEALGFQIPKTGLSGE
ncbi:MAG: hypothetical protein AAFY56_19250 [Pseudomonadota bacterium]